MREVFQVADDVRALVDGNGKVFADFCVLSQNLCFNAGVLRYIGNTSDFNETIESTADVLSAINAERYPDGADAYPSDSLGGIQRNASGSVTGWWFPWYFRLYSHPHHSCAVPMEITIWIMLVQGWDGWTRLFQQKKGWLQTLKTDQPFFILFVGFIAIPMACP